MTHSRYSFFSGEEDFEVVFFGGRIFPPNRLTGLYKTLMMMMFLELGLSLSLELLVERFLKWAKSLGTLRL